MKTRRHHNNKGTRQIQRGKPAEHMRGLAERLGIQYGTIERVRVEMVEPHPHAGTRGTIAVVDGKVTVKNIVGVDMILVDLVDSPLRCDKCFAQRGDFKVLR